MATTFADRRLDTLNRFYTRTAVGEVLVGLLDGLTPSSVVDLGVGEGSLSSAVVSRWEGVDAVTVDLDPAIGADLHRSLLDAGAASHRHYRHDVLDPELAGVVADHAAFDLAVCNPPFFRPAWKRDYARILQQADFADACPSTAEATAEILFLAQNLRLVRNGGKIALIVPDGLATGWRAAAFPRAVLNGHKLDCVVQLPNHSFHDTEARCFILVLTKGGGATENVTLLRYSESGLSGPLKVRRAKAEMRMDYDFHAHRTEESGRIVTLREIGADIRRGSLDTVARKGANYPVFHTTDYRDLVEGAAALEATDLPVDRKLVVAEAGDILMARVDRSLHEKVAIVTSGRAALTDCVYRVRVPAEARASVFAALRSPKGIASLLAATKSVSARLLGKGDLLDLPLHVAD